MPLATATLAAVVLDKPITPTFVVGAAPVLGRVYFGFLAGIAKAYRPGWHARLSRRTVQQVGSNRASPWLLAAPGPGALDRQPLAPRRALQYDEADTVSTRACRAPVSSPRPCCARSEAATRSCNGRRIHA